MIIKSWDEFRRAVMEYQNVDELQRSRYNGIKGFLMDAENSSLYRAADIYEPGYWTDEEGLPYGV
jgi:hypothetical protein